MTMLLVLSLFIVTSLYCYLIINNIFLSAYTPYGSG